MTDYDRIANAIEFITKNVNKQPTLKEIADYLHLSPFHFQRLFCRWAGVTPKRYLQILTVEHAKQLLIESKPLIEISETLGLSSGSRLYDHFIHLEAVTPGKYKTKGTGLTIEYGTHQTPFGLAFVATTPKGICNLSFLDNPDINMHLNRLHHQWPKACIVKNDESTQEIISSLFNSPAGTKRSNPISLHVTGTNFQISVWKALLQIQPAELTTYSQIAAAIGHPKAARAIGQAVGANPVAFIIPCHRVIQQSGKIGGYHWGETRKHAIHAWEDARNETP